MSNFDSALESLANQFKSWRRNRTHVKYPQSFWNEICKLAESVPTPTIAEALGINPNYLKSKIGKPVQQPMAFTPVKISYQTSSSIEFQAKNNKTVTIKFQASTEELARLIQSLS